MGETTNIRWKSTTPRNTLKIDALDTLAPPTRREAMANMPACSWLL